MSKTKTIPLEIPAEWEFDRATIDVPPSLYSERAIVNFHSPPTWTWFENPTDEMAKLRPDCEAWGEYDGRWRKAILIAVLEDARRKFKYAMVDTQLTTDGTNRCRVRLDRDGKVIVRWGDV